MSCQEAISPMATRWVRVWHCTFGANESKFIENYIVLKSVGDYRSYMATDAIGCFLSNCCFVLSCLKFIVYFQLCFCIRLILRQASAKLF